ncbi:MAG TPA: C25 family cysteine peptidase [Bacteroidales bacterium]|nr:C25 family cysteine peptidase [Bacteroidales bacterium]
MSLLKKISLQFLFLIISNIILAQTFGNEWIDYNKQYYRINVYTTGIYRITYSTLQAAGILSGNPDPRSFQIFGKGTEQYIYVKGENDGVFDPDDYIEFYAQKNDGWLDTYLYDKPENQGNPNYSLFTDTASYYLTFNNNWVISPSKRVIIENDYNFSSYSPASYIYKTSRVDYTSKYFLGETNSYGATDPDYTVGEGWFDDGFSLGQSITKTVPTTNVFAAGPAAKIDFKLIGASNYASLSPDHHVIIKFADVTIDTTYEGYKILNFSKYIDPAKLGSNNTTFIFSSIPLPNNGADRNTIAFISIKYPHKTEINTSAPFNFSIYDAQGQNKTYISFSNFNIPNTDTAIILDITNHRLIKTIKNGNNFNALIPNSGGEKECWLFSDSQVILVSQITPVNTEPTNYAKFVNYTSNIYINSDYFIITHKSLWNEALQYKNYRNSTGYIAQVIDIDQLYDQFSYGIRKNPLAIKNYMRYLWYNSYTKPKALFIIGKAYRAGTDGDNPSYRKNTTYWAGTLVPSLGVPPSDIRLTTGILDNLYQPAIPTGRLAAKTPEQVTLYLNKAIQYEAEQASPKEWMKNILHFGGGQSINEQNIFVNYLNNYKKTIEDTLFGGNVFTFLKTSSAPIQINQSDSLRNLINKGVSLMTFFGHAAGIGFDQSIDHPSEYNNYGKYPFLLANSCFAGDIYGNSINSSEEFVLIENKGVIGYLATISKSEDASLNKYSSEFYKNIAYKNYGKPVGQCIQNTIKNIQNNSIYVKAVCLEMTLHGDPAIKINYSNLPDYTINNHSIFYTPPNVTNEIDTFYINIISTNIGKAINDFFFIEIRRIFPDQSTFDTIIRVKATLFKDTISIKMPVDKIKGIGLNQFIIRLDAYNEIAEFSEANNNVQVNLFIKSADITPIYPYKYAIIPSSNVILKASTGYPFSPKANYVFELDTTDLFNSPLKITYNINHQGGVIEWTPQLPITTDSIVYFWRVSIDSLYSGSYNWRESSFQIITNKKGWGQSHFFQFKNNNYNYIKYNKLSRKLEFVDNIKSINIQTGYYPNIPWAEEYIKINGDVIDLWCCIGPTGDGMKFVILNPITGNTWISYDTCGYSNPCNYGPYGNWHCKNYNVRAFDFYTSSVIWRNKIKNFLDQIPQGHYIMGYSHRNHNAPSFEEGLYESFESFGFANIRTLPDKIPYIFMGIKGDTIGINTREVIGASQSSIIQLNDSIITKWNEGYVESEIIGPALKWTSLHWKQTHTDLINTDYVRLNVIGIKYDFSVDTLISNLPPDSSDIYNLNTKINANIYPYIKLIAFMKDDSLRTPALIKYWQVIYEAVPELALTPSNYFHFYKDTLQEGDTVRFSCAIQNVSEYNADSVLVKYWLIDNSRNIIPLLKKRLKPLLAGNIVIDSINFSTKNIPGNNNLWIEINPDNDQPEQYHFNNTGEINFYVLQDKINPILDVTFDGIHILNGDIVSAKPIIQISLNDENRYILLKDTSAFKIFIRYPNETIDRRIYFRNGSQEIIKFYPATSTNNICKAEWNPNFDTDGKYLLTVQAQDVSKNQSGLNDFKISFEVINKSTITDVLNWPNPFSTSTHFVFTLTGSEIPTNFKIQIMTISGKIVKEITKEEIGPIHIGRNITTYAWDGRDEFGDKLANGVYLYRVITDIQGQTIEKNDAATKQYFNHSFGKMVIIR